MQRTGGSHGQTHLGDSAEDESLPQVERFRLDQEAASAQEDAGRIAAQQNQTADRQGGDRRKSRHSGQPETKVSMLNDDDKPTPAKWATPPW
jgi:hypothetical protein